MNGMAATACSRIRVASVSRRKCAHPLVSPLEAQSSLKGAHLGLRTGEPLPLAGEASSPSSDRIHVGGIACLGYELCINDRQRATSCLEAAVPQVRGTNPACFRDARPTGAEAAARATQAEWDMPVSRARRALLMAVESPRESLSHG